MTKQNQEQRGCRECLNVDYHSITCSLFDDCDSGDYLSPVLDSERSPERHEYRPATNADYCVELRGVNPDQFTCGQPRDAGCHQVAPYWNDKTPCAVCSDERSAHKKGEGQCSACDLCRFFVRPMLPPQPPPDAARCGDHCGHDAADMDADGTCQKLIVGRGPFGPFTATHCGHRCTFPAPEAALMCPVCKTRPSFVTGNIRTSWDTCEICTGQAVQAYINQHRSASEADITTGGVCLHCEHDDIGSDGYCKALTFGGGTCGCLCEFPDNDEAPALAETPLTVEAALVELRELFPGEMNLGVDRSGGDGYIAKHGRIELRRERWSVHRRAIETIGSGATLSEAMRKVREYAERISHG